MGQGTDVALATKDFAPITARFHLPWGLGRPGPGQGASA